MSADLTIPDEAIERAAVTYSNYDYVSASESERAAYRCSADAALRGGAPLIVAAELERLAKGRSMIAPEELLGRAAELRGDRKAEQR